MIGDTKKPFRNYMEFSEYGTSTSATHATKVVLSPGSSFTELAVQSQLEIVVIRFLVSKVNRVRIQENISGLL